MTEDPKKRAAVISAVAAYLKGEEEALLMAGQMPAVVDEPEPPRAAFSLWALGGRQTAMNTRQMMQLKAFNGYRAR